MHDTVTSFLNYIAFEKRYSKHTHLSYSNDLKQFELFLKTNESNDIPFAVHMDIRNWIVSMMELKITPRSITRKISALKSYYKFLLRKNIIAKNPVSKVQVPKSSSRLPVFVEKQGIEKLLEQTEFPEGYEGMRDKLVIELFYGTGMRRNELVNLRETDIDSYSAQIKVLGKGNKERIIPIHPNLRTSIRLFTEEKKKHFENLAENYLFVSEQGKKLDPSKIYSIVKKYLSLITTAGKRVRMF